MPPTRTPPKNNVIKKMVTRHMSSSSNKSDVDCVVETDEITMQSLFMILKNVESKLHEHDSILQRIILCVESEQNNQNELSKQIKQIIKEDNNKNSNAVKTTYAEKLKSSGPVVLITPRDKSQNSDQTKEFIKNKIDPITNKINGIRKAAKGAVVVECKDTEAIRKFQSDAQTNLGTSYQVELPKRRKPKLRISGFSDQMSEEKLIECLIKQNEILKNDDSIKVLNMKEIKNKKFKQYQAIIEASPDTYFKMLKQEKVCVNWDRCSIFEYISVRRCFNCFGFNHNASECKSKTACKYCAQEHKSEDCRNNERKCVNCVWHVNNLKMNIDTNHDAFYQECPVFKRKIEQEKRKIDFEQ